MKKVAWLDRDVFTAPFDFALFTNEADYLAGMAKTEVGRKRWPEFVPENSLACVHQFYDGLDRPLAIVCINESTRYSSIQIAATLVHEAVHLWQMAMELVGETKPSDEFMAYGIQKLSQTLMYEYAEQKGFA